MNRSTKIVLASGLVVAIAIGFGRCVAEPEKRVARAQLDVGASQGDGRDNGAMAEALLKPPGRVAVGGEGEAASETDGSAVDLHSDWPDFPVGSIGSLLKQHHSASWSVIAPRFPEHYDLTLSPSHYGVADWSVAQFEVAKLIEQEAANAKRHVIASVTGCESEEMWRRKMLDRLESSELDNSRMAQVKALIENVSGEIAALSELAAPEIARFIEAQFLAKRIRVMPFAGWMDTDQDLRTAVVARLTGVSGWHVNLIVMPGDVPTVSTYLEQAKQLVGETNKLFLQ